MIYLVKRWLLIKIIWNIRGLTKLIMHMHVCVYVCTYVNTLWVYSNYQGGRKTSSVMHVVIWLICLLFKHLSKRRDYTIGFTSDFSSTTTQMYYMLFTSRLVVKGNHLVFPHKVPIVFYRKLTPKASWVSKAAGSHSFSINAHDEGHLAPRLQWAVWCQRPEWPSASILSWAELNFMRIGATTLKQQPIAVRDVNVFW